MFGWCWQQSVQYWHSQLQYCLQTELCQSQVWKQELWYLIEKNSLIPDFWQLMLKENHMLMISNLQWGVCAIRFPISHILELSNDFDKTFSIFILLYWLTDVIKMNCTHKYTYQKKTSYFKWISFHVIFLKYQQCTAL